MPAITERSTKKPLLNVGVLSHGTLHCLDIAKTRRFYEEVLGMEVIQTSAISLMVRKGTEQVYAVVEQPPGTHPPMDFFNHNGFDVETRADVERARAQIMAIKDEWGLQKVLPVSAMHGDVSFFFMDFDGNWWEIVAPREGGYIANFDDREHCDLTGQHAADGWVGVYIKEKKLLHVHDSEARALLEQQKKL
ncbi:MAG TPA: VOC family protein [Steroidobacteraceae bacterium]|nr:VOC family protein [Steroidobacteraceae bacterium]